MPHFCCAGGCTNSSDKQDLSFHSLPLRDKKRLNLWITKMKRDPKFFRVNKHAKICSSHFTEDDFIEPLANKKRLKRTAVPSKFIWTEPGRESTERQVLGKLQVWHENKDEETDTASEGEGDVLDPQRPSSVSRNIQTDYSFEELDLPCQHSFSVSHLLSKSTTEKKEEKFFTHFTGFNSNAQFKETLRFLVPNLDRNNLVYYDTKEARSKLINAESLFEDEELNEGISLTVESTKRPGKKISIEDEFLMVMMKLRMGLSNLDLAERFNLSESTVSVKLITWFNYLYVILGSLKIWPGRNIILSNSPQEFVQKYPNTVVIIDATELQIEVPSSLQKQSETYSSYKSHTTLKCLLGVDPKGGIIFVSQLYEGSISDKEIVKRSGFLSVLKQKLEMGELHKGDAVMADKGFDIENELKAMGLNLNIPTFLRAKGSFSEEDVIRTQTIAMHRIHVERAIGKVRRFHLFNSVIPVTMFGTINQIWTVSCLLSNFQNPIL